MGIAHRIGPASGAISNQALLRDSLIVPVIRVLTRFWVLSNWWSLYACSRCLDSLQILAMTRLPIGDRKISGAKIGRTMTAAIR